MSISHFNDYFRTFLQDNHPDLIIKLRGDYEDYVEQRVAEAEEHFATLTQNGAHTDAAIEQCYELLKVNLKFSKFNHIDSIIKERFPEKAASFTETNNYKDLVLSFIPLCEGIYERFEVNDDFPYDDNLDNEVSSLIAKRLK